jgi:hypothetical protein
MAASPSTQPSGGLCSVSEGVSEAISLSRFKQALLGVVHENGLLEQRSQDLELRLQEEVEAAKTRQAELADMQRRLDEATRKEEETDQRTAAQHKAAEDERSRHELQQKLTSDKAKAAQAKLQQQGQQLYSLEEQLRARTAEVSRLRLEQEEAEDLISTFRARIEEVSRVIEATARAEHACKDAIGGVRKDQEAMRHQLQAVEATQRAAAPRAHLEQRLKLALREVQQARDAAADKERAHAAKEAELAATHATLARTAEALNGTQAQANASHMRELGAHAQRRAAVEQLQKAQASSLRQAEKSEGLMWQLAQGKAVTQLLLRELAHADANAHEAGASRAHDMLSARCRVNDECMLSAC